MRRQIQLDAGECLAAHRPRNGRVHAEEAFEMKGVRVVERFVTPAGPEAVWKVLSDVERWCDWTPTVVEIVPLKGSKLSLGAKYRVTQPKLRPAIYEVTECVPNKAFTWVRR